LAYSPETGEFRHRLVSGRLGRRAGFLKPDGYRQIKIDGIQYYEHRIAWVYVHGVDPEEMDVDHVNRVRSDNRIENLRLLSHHDNTASRVIGSGSLPRGVVRAKQKGDFYCARLKNRHVGTYPTPEEAHQAYLDAGGSAFT
jgi:hypothetical protein